MVAFGEATYGDQKKVNLMFRDGLRLPPRRGTPEEL